MLRKVVDYYYYILPILYIGLEFEPDYFNRQNYQAAVVISGYNVRGTFETFDFAQFVDMLPLFSLITLGKKKIS